MKQHSTRLHLSMVVLLLVTSIVGCGKQSSQGSAATSKPMSAASLARETLRVSRLEIVARIRDLQQQGKYMEAMEVAAPLAEIQDQEIAALREELKPKARIQSLQQDIALIPADSWILLASIYSELATLEPKNKTYVERSKYYSSRSKTEQVKAERAAVDDEARQARAEVAARKKLGVHVGMRAEDVVHSSWGKPNSINKTTTKFGVHEQWVYDSRNFLYVENGVVTAIQN